MATAGTGGGALLLVGSLWNIRVHRVRYEHRIDSSELECTRQR